MTLDQADLDFVLEFPNMWSTIASLFENPTYLKEYMANSCQDAILGYPYSQLYAWVLPLDENDSLGADEFVLICRDAFSGLETFVADLSEVAGECDAPSWASPNCFSDTGNFHTPSSKECADAIAKAWNIPKAEPLREVASMVMALNDACAGADKQVLTFQFGLRTMYPPRKRHRLGCSFILLLESSGETPR
jgi:hypothetical protein